MFNTDDDDSADGSKKRKLVPLDYDDDKLDKKASTAEEKRAKIKTLIESIPTAKDELFAYSLDWSIVDQVSGLVWPRGYKTFFLFSSIEHERATCIKGQIWPPLEPKIESCFSPISSYWFIRRIAQV